MNPSECRRALEAFRPDQAELARLEGLMGRLAPSSFLHPAFRDGGWVLSLAGEGDALRGYQDLHCSPDGHSPGRFRSLALERLQRIEYASSWFMGRAGSVFDLSIFSRIAVWMENQARPPWPYAGFKSRAEGSSSISIYLSDLQPEPGSRLLPPRSLLDVLGSAAEEGLLPGALDCLGVTLGPGRAVSAKLYARFPRPERRDDLARVVELHGRPGASSLAWWLSLESSHPSRFWTQARRLGPADSSVKTEIHFSDPVEARRLLALAPPSPWLTEALSRVEQAGARVSCLAMEGDRPFVYFK